MTTAIITSTGGKLYRPTTTVSLLATAARTKGRGTAEGTFAIVGEAIGGEPNKAYVFDGASIEREALDIFRGGDLLSQIESAMSANPNAAARPTSVVAVNMRPGYQSAFFFNGSSAAITITAGAGSTLTNLAVTAIAGLTGSIPKGTILSFAAGAKVVQTTANVVNGATAIPVRTIQGAVLVSAETASFVEPVFGLRARKWGIYANSVSAELTGSLALGYRVKITDNDLGSPWVDQDKLGLAFTVIYTGGAAGAKTVAVQDVLGVLTLQTIVTAAPAENLSIPLLGSLTFAQLAMTINATGVYRVLLNGWNDRLLASGIDLLVATSIVTATQLTAVKTSFANFFKSGTAVQLLEYVDGGATAFAATPLSGNFAGGGTGTSAPSDWVNGAYALAASEQKFGNWAATTSDPAILASLRVVNNTMWSPEVASFPSFWMAVPDTDLPLDESSGNLTAYLNSLTNTVATINSFNTMLVVQTMDGTLPDGTQGRLKTWQVAGNLAGLRASQGRGALEPLTYRNMKGSNLYPKLDTVGSQTNSNRAVQIGVFGLEVADTAGAIRPIYGRTTYVGGDNAVYESEANMAKFAAVGRGVKLILQEATAGQNINQAKLAALDSDLKSYYNIFADQGYLTAGKDANGLDAPAFVSILLDTEQQGGLVRHTATLSLTPEGRVAEANLVAQLVDISVSS